MDDISDVDFSSDSMSESGDADAGDSTGYPGISSLPTSDTGLHSDSGMGSTSAHVSSSEDREQVPVADVMLPSSSSSSSHEPAIESDDVDQGTSNVGTAKTAGLLDQLAKIPPRSSPDKSLKTATHSPLEQVCGLSACLL